MDRKRIIKLNSSNFLFLFIFKYNFIERMITYLFYNFHLKRYEDIK